MLIESEFSFLELSKVEEIIHLVMDYSSWKHRVLDQALNVRENSLCSLIEALYLVYESWLPIILSLSINLYWAINRLPFRLYFPVNHQFQLWIDKHNPLLYRNIIELRAYSVVIPLTWVKWYEYLLILLNSAIIVTHYYIAVIFYQSLVLHKRSLHLLNYLFFLLGTLFLLSGLRELVER